MTACLKEEALFIDMWEKESKMKISQENETIFAIYKGINNKARLF